MGSDGLDPQPRLKLNPGGNEHARNDKERWPALEIRSRLSGGAGLRSRHPVCRGEALQLTPPTCPQRTRAAGLFFCMDKDMHFAYAQK